MAAPARETHLLDVVCMLARHFRDPRFAEPAEAPTLPPPPIEPPDATILEDMARDLAGYGTEVVGPPDPPEQQ